MTQEEIIKKIEEHETKVAEFEQTKKDAMERQAEFESKLDQKYLSFCKQVN